MSKAILIIDMPSSCGKCMMCTYHETRFSHRCRVIRGSEIEEEQLKEKPTWCPLREVPQKMEQYGARDGIARGYNACLDDILGGGE